jgi:hypothetical protein
MATEGTKFQINYKLNDGTLINLYAANVKELESGLADLGMISSLISSVGNDLHGGATSLQTTLVSAGVNPTVAAVAQQFNATPVAAPATTGGAQEVRDRYGNLWVYNLPEAPECARGKMVLKHGTAQATGKPYKGWFDPAAGPNWSGPKVPKEQHAQTIWA